MIYKLTLVLLVAIILIPLNTGVQAQDECSLEGYAEQAQPLLEQVNPDASPAEIDALRLKWHDVSPDTCTYQHHSLVQYALSELYISALLKNSDPSLSQEHTSRYQEAWNTAQGIYAALMVVVEATSSQQNVARDGLTRETAFLLGEAGPILGEQGSFIIERVIRGATYRDASILDYKQPDSGSEFLLIWAKFTCAQSLCDSIENASFYLIGDEAVVYGNQVLVRGGLFEDQLAGQTLQGGSVSGWLLFQISQTDTGLVLVDSGDSPRFFSLSAFPPGAEYVTIIAGGNVNLRSCASTDCDIVGQASNGEQLMILEEIGDWFHIRASNGTEGYIFGNLVKR